MFVTVLSHCLADYPLHMNSFSRNYVPIIVLTIRCIFAGYSLVGRTHALPDQVEASFAGTPGGLFKDTPADGTDYRSPLSIGI